MRAAAVGLTLAAALTVTGIQIASADQIDRRCAILSQGPNAHADINSKACYLQSRGTNLGQRQPIEATDRGGAVQRTDAGQIVWSAATGAHLVNGDILTKWLADGGVNGPGFPKTDETATPDGRGRYSHFEFGSVYWTAPTGAHLVHGAILDRWAGLGWEAGLGFPVGDEEVVPDNRGRVGRFERGVILWSPDSGAFSVSGRILDKFTQDGGAAAMGYPVEEAYGNTTPFCQYQPVRRQKFIRPDGSGGVYCERDGYTSYQTLREGVPPNLGGGGVVGGGGSHNGGSPNPPANPPADPPGGGGWVCATSGIPSGMVATQYDRTRCSASGAAGGMFITRPATGQWVCGYAQDVLKDFVVERTEGAAGACEGGPRHLLRKK